MSVVRVTGLSQDKFTTGNIHGYSKRRKQPPMTFNVVNSEGLRTQGKRAHQVCWAGFRNDICRKNMFYSWHVIKQWVVAEL